MNDKKAEELGKSLDLIKKVKIQVYLNVFVVTLGSVLIFLLIGYIIDSNFNTKPWGIIISLLISFPITQFLVFKTAKKLLKNARN